MLLKTRTPADKPQDSYLCSMYIGWFMVAAVSRRLCSGAASLHVLH